MRKSSYCSPSIFYSNPISSDSHPVPVLLWFWVKYMSVKVDEKLYVCLRHFEHSAILSSP